MCIITVIFWQSNFTNDAAKEMKQRIVSKLDAGLETAEERSAF
jgi:ATP-dependent exoDNAse (exonuclease V) beta subunit